MQKLLQAVLIFRSILIWFSIIGLMFNATQSNDWKTKFASAISAVIIMISYTLLFQGN